jgi:hypothetical protein
VALAASAVGLALLLVAVPARGGAPRKAEPAYVQQVRATVDQHLAEMVPCMEASKPKNGAKVKLQVQLMILSDGAVLTAKRGAKGKGPKGDAAIESCMLAKVKSWRFPAPPDRATVAVEFPIELEYAK